MSDARSGEENVNAAMGRRQVLKGLGAFGAAGALIVGSDATPAEASTRGASARAAVFIDDYGSDPTGQSASDSAWKAAYEVAVATASADNSASGAMIEFGPGVYTFSVDTIVVTNPQIGIRGQGQGVSVLAIVGSGGDGLFVGNTTGATGQAAAPVEGITIDGWQAGANVNGFHYGDRPLSRLEFEVVGFHALYSRNLWFRNDANTAAGCEGTVARIHTAAGGASLICFDGNHQSPAGGTFDYSDWWFHVVSGPVNQNFAVCQFVNRAHANGVSLSLVGNAQGADGYASTVLQIGADTSDTSMLGNAQLHVAVENDGGTVIDLAIAAAEYAGGMLECFGQFSVADDGGTTVAGTLRGEYVASVAGVLGAPIFATGQQSQLGVFSSWDGSGTQRALLNTVSGAVQPGGGNGPGARIFSGAGAPRATAPVLSPQQGDVYLRTDTPAAADQRIYMFDGTDWTGIV